MINMLAIQVDYWAIQDSPTALHEIEGIAEFQADLRTHYLARVHGRPGDLGGGLYEFVIRVLANVSLEDLAKLIADGVAFDLLKSGTRSFVLRPFLGAYKNLRSRNLKRDIDIHELRFLFNDAEVVITKISKDSVYESLGEIFRMLAECYEILRNGQGEYPYSLQIPVFEDPDKKICRFRTLLDVDETISKVTAADYMGYWGVYYDFERKPRVFDVQRRLLIDSDFLTNERYWQEWVRERKREESA